MTHPYVLLTRLVGLLLLLLPAASALAQETKLTASDIYAVDGVANAWFGSSVSITPDGSYALVGARGAFAYIFQRSGGGWVQQAKLRLSGSASAVAISADGTTALVGVMFEEIVYVFRRSGRTWYQQAELTGSQEYFGRSVSLNADGSYALVGGRNLVYEGERDYVSVFQRASGGAWLQRGRLTGYEDRRFGSSVSLSADGRYALIGGSGGSDGGGYGYIFRRLDSDGFEWREEARLNDGGGYGRSVSISADGTTALIEVMRRSSESVSVSVRVFQRFGSRWEQQATLSVPGDRSYDAYDGNSVSLSPGGTWALIGNRARRDLDSGVAYLYRRHGDTWRRQATLTASDGAAGDEFGSSVSLAVGYTPFIHIYALVGAPGHDDVGTESGSAYVFESRPLDVCLPLDPLTTEPFAPFIGIEDPYGSDRFSEHVREDFTAFITLAGEGEGEEKDQEGKNQGGKDQGGGIQSVVFTELNNVQSIDFFEIQSDEGVLIQKGPFKVGDVVQFKASGVEALLFQGTPIDPKQPVQFALEAENAKGARCACKLDEANLKVTSDPKNQAAAPQQKAVALAPEAAVSADVPEAFTLEPNYPNPFNPATRIAFALPEAADVRLAVYDVTGREVAVLAEGPKAAGAYAVEWAGRDGAGRVVPSGVYLYRLEAGTFTQTRRMVLLK